MQSTSYMLSLIDKDGYGLVNECVGSDGEGGGREGVHGPFRSLSSATIRSLARTTFDCR